MAMGGQCCSWAGNWPMSSTIWAADSRRDKCQATARNMRTSISPIAFLSADCAIGAFDILLVPYPFSLNLIRHGQNWT